MTPEEELEKASKSVALGLCDTFTDECIRNQEEVKPEIAINALYLGLTAATAENLVKWYFAGDQREKTNFLKFMGIAFGDILVAADAVYKARLKEKDQ